MTANIETIIARGYQLAAQRNHELVTLEHLLASLLELKEIQQLITRNGGDLESLTKDNMAWLDTPENHVLVKSSQYQPRHTTLLMNVVKKSKTQSMFSGKQEVGSIDILLAMYGIADSPASYFLDRHAPSRDTIANYLTNSAIADAELMDPREAEEILRTYCINLNERALDGKIDPLIGREKEVEQITQILARRNKHNVIMIGDPGVGKAQPLDSLILTPDGWIQMGDIKPGVSVCTPSGLTTKVTGVFPQGIKDIYKITFSDGRTVECCGEHLWKIYGNFGETYKTPGGWRRNRMGYRIVSTFDMIKMLDKNYKKVRIPLIKPIDRPDVDQPLDPWLMGFLLGDGSFARNKLGSFSTADDEILDIIASKLKKGYYIKKHQHGTYDYHIITDDHDTYGHPVVGNRNRYNQYRNIYRRALADMGFRNHLSTDKFIPDIYKNGSIDQRLDLLAGLVDSDGYVSSNGSLSISTSSVRLACDIQELVWSLGGCARITTKNPTYTYNGELRNGHISYNVAIKYQDPQRLSYLKRKKDRLPVNYQYKDLKLTVKSIELIRQAEAQCIMVDDPDHLYITNNYVVTHNTVIVEGLAKRIAEKQVPETLESKTIWSIDIASLVAGTKYRGDFEERMKQIIRALQSDPESIAFIDEIHMIMGAGSGGGGNGSIDAANMLKPALSRGEIRCIGSTTQEEYRKHFEKDRALVRRFQKIDINEPSIDDAKRILKGISTYYEKYHGVSYTDAALDAAVELTAKHIHDKCLPDKAIDVIDSAAAWQRIRPADVRLTRITKREIEVEVGRLAKIPVASIKSSETDKLASLDADLKNVVFGQDQALDNLVDSVYMSRSGLRENDKTLGAYLFTGPSGVGKTEAAKQLALSLGIDFIRFDMSEYQERHSVSKFIGSPPGYVGYGDGSAGSGLLINNLEKSPHCVLLFDEIEKAHQDVYNIFLQMMDRGVVTSSNGKSVSARNAVVIFTSNLGAAEMEKELIGFAARTESRDEDTRAVNTFFTPEFRNRLDGIIRFNRLSKENMSRIVDKFIGQLNAMSGKKNVNIVLDQAAREWLIDKGFDKNMGARPLARVIAENIKKPLSREILFGRLRKGGAVMVTLGDGKLEFEYMEPASDDGGSMDLGDQGLIADGVDA